MLTPICLIHYHELGLKGQNRASFEQALVKNLNFALKDLDIASIERISGRIRIALNSFESISEVERISLNTPGVVRVSCGYKTSREIEDILDAAKRVAEDTKVFNTFRVTARRSNTDFPIPSQELNCIVGDAISALYPNAKVQLKTQDLNVHVEVIQGSTYVYGRSSIAVGGLPSGTAGKLVSLLSSGIDSPVSSWRMIKRGATVIGLHFSGRPQTPADSEYAVQEIARAFEHTGAMPRVYIVPFGDYQRQISSICSPDLRIIMYRRLMLLVAERLAKIEHAKGLITGESLGQVASQTLDNMAVVNDAVSIPVYRPLIGNDKQEIIAEANRLGTFEISARNCSDCCTLFMPRSPQTHAKLEIVQQEWKKLPIEEMVTSIFEEIEYFDFPSCSYRPPKQYRF